MWIDQPVGSGFSQGEVTARDQFDVARQLMGFWRNFVNLYSMQGYKVYITGSSYSGLYCPYVAHEMIEANDAENFNVAGMMIFDALYSTDVPAREMTAVPFTDKWKDALQFNASFDQEIHAAAEACGYPDYLDKFLVFPPSGQQPAITSLPGMSENGTLREECSLFTPLISAAFDINPCFSIYSVLSKCPRRFDPLGFSDGTNFMPDGATVYLNRPDVKAAIKAPVDMEWEFCSSDPVFVDGIDLSLDGGPGSLPVLPRVIDATQNVVLGHGAQDFVLPEAGALLALQNISWGGQMGFQAAPSRPLVLPFSTSDPDDLLNIAPGGTVGTWTQERGLTYFGAATTGHFLAMEAPSLAYRALEVLLGRVEDFDSPAGFTTDDNSAAGPSNATNEQRVDALAAGENGLGPESGASTVASMAMWLACTIVTLFVSTM